jgi:uncharacterized protein YeaC (DUF1315 family)
MKKIPRAQISTIKGVLFPERKNSQKEWNKKILQNLRQMEEKNKKIREEKKNYITPEPYKIEKYKHIPSKLKADTVNWITHEQKRHNFFPRTVNVGQLRHYSNQNSFHNGLTQNSIINKTSSINNAQRPLLNEMNGKKEENIYNILQNNKNSMFDKYYGNIKKYKTSPSLYNLSNNLKTDSNINNNIGVIGMNNDLNNCVNNEENIYNIQNQNINTNSNMNININENIKETNEQMKTKNEAIEKLIKEYKEKYGTDDALESLINNYYGKMENKKDSFVVNKTNNNKDDKFVLPRIQKNYIRENRKLVIENRIPLKYKKVEEPKNIEVKHKNFGKVPLYIKKYELEREMKKEEMKKMEEMAKYPKGTKLLTEEERLNTLNGLIENKKEINNKLEKMPITTRTNSIRVRKEELFKKLEEIEKAIEMFSKKQVFVKM